MLDEFELRDLFPNEDEEESETNSSHPSMFLKGNSKRSPTPFRSKTKYDHLLALQDKRIAQGNEVARRIRRKIN